jgi:hypothetical protein
MTFQQLLIEWCTQNHSSPFSCGYIKEYDRITKAMKRNKWLLGYKDRGNGNGDYAITVKIQGKVILVVECPCRDIAEHVIKLHNQ